MITIYITLFAAVLTVLIVKTIKSLTKQRKLNREAETRFIINNINKKHNFKNCRT